MTLSLSRRRSRAWLAALCLAGLSASLLAQQPPPPQFRTGVDLTRVEITVLHRDTRKPITGLTAEDFVITVDGDVQRVATLAEVTVPSTREAAAPGFMEAAHDVAGNDLPRPRLFAHPYGEHDRRSREAARQAGFSAAFGLAPRAVTRRSDRFALPRFEVLASTSTGDVLRMAGLA